MARSVDLVYDRLVAGDKVKSSDKYEVLAAIVFFALEGQATIHDMRLRGASGARHQIDVVVGSGGTRRRALIECKDYDKKIGLPLVRNFFGAVEDIQPDEAFMVTTVGFTGPAELYGSAKRIRLAVLRPPENDEDWGNVVKRIEVEIVPVVPTDLRVSWLVPKEEAAHAESVVGVGLATDPEEMQLRERSGRSKPFKDVWGRIWSTIPLDSRGTFTGTETFESPRELMLPDGAAFRVSGFEWSVRIVGGSHKFSVGFGIGGLTAELVLRTLDGQIHRIISNRHLAAYTVDRNGKVRLRA